MTNDQLYLAIGIPSLINIGLISLLYLVLSRQVEITTQPPRPADRQRLPKWRSASFTMSFSREAGTILRLTSNAICHMVIVTYGE